MAALRAGHENILFMYQKIYILITGFFIVVTREITQRYMATLFGDNPVCRYLFSVITAPAASQLAFRPATSANPSAA